MGKSKKSGGKTYKMIDLVGTSTDSYEDAIETAIKDASKTLEGLDWFEVTQFRGAIGEGGKIAEFQAVIRVGFRVLR